MPRTADLSNLSHDALLGAVYALIAGKRITPQEVRAAGAGRLSAVIVRFNLPGSFDGTSKKFVPNPADTFLPHSLRAYLPVIPSLTSRKRDDAAQQAKRAKEGGYPLPSGRLALGPVKRKRGVSAWALPGSLQDYGLELAEAHWTTRARGPDNDESIAAVGMIWARTPVPLRVGDGELRLFEELLNPVWRTCSVWENANIWTFGTYRFDAITFEGPLLRYPGRELLLTSDGSYSLRSQGKRRHGWR